MNAEQHLYDVLRPSRDTSIPLDKAAEYFINVKLASGGLLATEVDLLKKVAEGGLSAEDLQDAQEKGLLQGVRASVAQHIQHGEKLRASKGERWGKALGTAAGAVTGLVAGKSGTAADRAVRAGVGALAGHALGKATGQGVDAHREAHPKIAPIQKEAAPINPAALMRLREALSAIDLDSLRDTAISSGVEGGAQDALSDTLSTAGSMAGSAMPGRYKIPSIIAGHFAGKGIANLAGRSKEASADKIARVIGLLQKAAQLDSPTAVGTDEAMEDSFPADTNPKAATTRGVTGDPIAAEPFVSPDQDLLPSPLDGILDLLQKGNEAEQYQQKAEDAEQVAQRAEAAAELAKGELTQAQKEQEIATQQQAEELHAARTEAGAASGESQMLHQQIMSGAQQTQEAQAQATQLLQGMNQFRQGLIDYLAQDPSLAAVPGMMAPTPGSGQMMQDPSGMGMGAPGGDPNAAAMGGDPNAAAGGAPGAQPGAPAEAAPPAAGGGESSGGEAAKPEKAEKKESKGGEDKGGGGKGTTIHVH